MDSILRAFGRSPKVVEKKENVKAKETSVLHENENHMDTPEDDLFSDLVVSSPMAANSVLPCHHLNEIQDLDVTLPVHIRDDQVSKCHDDGPSAFVFMNQDQEEDENHTCSKQNIVKTDDLKNQKMSIDKGSETSSVGKEVQSDLDSNKSEVSCVGQENDSLSKFSFIRKDLPSKPVDKPRENTQGALRPKNVKKTKHRSTKPGFGNICTGQLKKSSSGTSLEGRSEYIESTSCITSDKEIQEDNVCNNEIISKHQLDKLDVSSGTENNDTLESCDDNNKHENEINTIEGSIGCNTGNQNHVVNTCKKDLNIVIDTNLKNSENVECDEYTTTVKNEKYASESTSLNQENIEVDEDKNKIAIETVTKTNHSDCATTIVSCDATPNHDGNENSSICISEGDENNSIYGNDPKELSTNQNVSYEKLPQITDSEISADTEVFDKDINKTENDNIEFSEEENTMLKLDVLQCQEEIFREAKSASVKQQKELINEWKSEHLSESSIRLKINELRQLQVKLESEEDYDKAAEINQNIVELINQCDNHKYQHPLLDQKFLNLIKDYGSLCAHHKNEHEAMLKEYENIMNWYKAKNDENEISEEKKLNEMTLLLKEKKLKVERDISHTSLDKEHLIKNEIVLSEEINKQTKELNKEKEELTEKKAIIQANIEELMKKLNILQEEENDLTTSIVNIESKIQSIMDDFQPRIDEISREKASTEEQESILTHKLDDLVAEERKIKSRNADILNQREKNQEILCRIASNILGIEKSIESSGKESFSFHNSLDFEGLEFDADAELVRSEEQMKALQSKLKDIINKVLADEGEEKRLQRSMNDLEAQLSELQKLKQVHVKERKYKDAKLTSDEIKTLTSKGENISCDAIKLNESIKLQKNEIEELKIQVAQAQEKFKDKELIHDQNIIEKLRKMNISINNLLNSRLESWTVGILELQLFNNNNIIHDLSSKHGLLSDKESVEVNVDIEVIKENLEELESALEIAVMEENWERAEDINISIEEKKKLIQDTS